MNAARYAEMSDPTMNRNFNRRWEEPPQKESRRPECKSGTAANSQKGCSMNNTGWLRLSTEIELEWRRRRCAA